MRVSEHFAAKDRDFVELFSGQAQVTQALRKVTFLKGCDRFLCKFVGLLASLPRHLGVWGLYVTP